MKRILLSLLAVAAGCSGETQRFEGEVQPPDMPPVPPEKILREPVDFRFTDFASAKEFLLRFYHDDLVSEEIVTVLEKGKRERLATLSERDYALSIFLADWKSTGDRDKLRYHLELLENELRRNTTLLDYKVQGKEYEVRQLEERRDSVLYNIRARKDTNFSPKEAKDCHSDLKEGQRCTCPNHEASTQELERELADAELKLRVARAELEILKYRKALRDGEYSRSSAAYFRRDAIYVADILPAYSGPDRLIALVRTNVHPDTWDRSLVRIEVKDGHLLLTQHTDVIERVRAYIEHERIAFRNRPKQK